LADSYSYSYHSIYTQGNHTNAHTYKSYRTMSHQHPQEHEHEHEEDDHELAEDDVVEVVEDFGDEPMDDDDDDDNEKYDGEIVIGAPQPGEEEAMEMMEDNTMGATCKSQAQASL
jgi:hypothetical protein